MGSEPPGVGIPNKGCCNPLKETIFQKWDLQTSPNIKTLKIVSQSKVHRGYQIS